MPLLGAQRRDSLCFSYPEWMLLSLCVAYYYEYHHLMYGKSQLKMMMEKARTDIFHQKKGKSRDLVMMMMKEGRVAKGVMGCE